MSSTGTVGRRALDRWQAFLFDEIPPESYALLRILFGLLGFASIVSLVPVSTFWSPDGLVPLPGGGLGIRSALERAGLGEAAGWGLFLALLGSFGCMAAGYRSRIAVPLCFVLSIVHQNFWNGLPLSGANRVILLMLFYLAWVDCGRSLSVDAWLAARRGFGGDETGHGSPVWPLRLIRAHIALIYATTGLWKLASELWRDGSAIHYVLHLNVFARFPYAIPPPWEWLTTVATYVTLFWELAFPLLLLHPLTRRFALGLGVCLHIGMAVTMELALFSWVMIASYIAFVDPRRLAGFVTARFTSKRSLIASPAASPVTARTS